MSEPRPSFSASTRWTIRFNVGLALFSLVVLLAALNYLSLHYFKRYDLASDPMSRLSQQSINLLKSLTNEVHVTVFFRPQGDVYSMTSRLLNEYQSESPRYFSVRTLNYALFDGEARDFLAKHKMGALKDHDFVLFECGNQTRIVNSHDLYDLNVNEVIRGTEDHIRRNTFKGEMLFSSALLSVTYPRPMKVYFLQGHGEHDPADGSPDRGYLKFAELLKDECNVETATLLLRGTNEVPVDCQTLIVAGPYLAPFAEAELKKVSDYLDHGGRLLVLLNNLNSGNHSGIEAILEKWGVGVLDIAIDDHENSTTGNDILITHFASGKGSIHPIVSSLGVNNLGIKLYAPRVVFAKQVARGADAPKVDAIAYSGPDSFMVQNPSKRGSVPFAVAVEQGSIKDVTLNRGNTRIVVLGDSLVFDNANLDSGSGNHYFANLVGEWLLDRPQFLLGGLSPQPLREYKLLVTKSQMFQVKWLLLGVLPGSVLLIGALVHLGRRR